MPRASTTDWRRSLKHPTLDQPTPTVTVPRNVSYIGSIDAKENMPVYSLDFQIKESITNEPTFNYEKLIRDLLGPDMLTKPVCHKTSMSLPYQQVL